MAAFAVGVAACGGGGGGAPAPAAQTTTGLKAAAPAATAAGSPRPTGQTSSAAAPAPAGPASPVAATSQSGSPRVVKHAMGETTVPAHPQRVVVLDTGELDSALALGITPVGAVTVFQDGNFQAYLRPLAGDIKTVGTIAQPNLEAIAALKPDLILSSKLRHEAIYDKLAQIAPTVFTKSVGVSWKENFALHAEALGRAEKARELMAAYDGRVAEFRRKMGDRLAKTQVSILRSFPDHVRVYMNESFIGTLLKDAGLPRPPAQGQPKFAERVTTKEGIPLMDGDVIFVLHYSPDQGSLLKTWLGDPLWQQLGAVKAGRVYEARTTPGRSASGFWPPATS